MSPQHNHAVHAHGSFLIELLDLDAVVHSAMLEEAMSVVGEISGGSREVARILDVGAGTGTGTMALAARFPEAQLAAIDIDERMLALVRDRAGEHGLSDRVETIALDVAAETSALGRADLIWSSAALHEVADVGQAFRNLFSALRPGGHLIIVEMDAPPLLLPDALADLEGRLRAAAGTTPATDHLDWSATLARTGFEDVSTRTLVTDRVLPAAGPAGDYAALELRRIGQAAMPRLGDSDRAALTTLMGDGAGGVRRLGELRIRSSRTLWAGRRP